MCTIPQNQISTILSTHGLRLLLSYILYYLEVFSACTNLSLGLIFRAELSVLNHHCRCRVFLSWSSPHWWLPASLSGHYVSSCLESWKASKATGTIMKAWWPLQISSSWATNLLKSGCTDLELQWTEQKQFETATVLEWGRISEANILLYVLTRI